MKGFYWSHEACGWVPTPTAGDALATPWSGTDVRVPPVTAPLRDGWDVLGWFPPVPGLPEPRTVAAGDREEASSGT
jgi:hypothetical protein